MVVEGKGQPLPKAEEIPDLLVLGVRADVLDVDGGRHVDDGGGVAAACGDAKGHSADNAYTLNNSAAGSE